MHAADQGLGHGAVRTVIAALLADDFIAFVIGRRGTGLVPVPVRPERAASQAERGQAADQAQASFQTAASATRRARTAAASCSITFRLSSQPIQASVTLWP